jgi:tRNA-modifying protein YgfZ
MMNFPKDSAIFPYRPACVLKVSGPDAATFLQGQLTNDLRDIRPRQSVYGLWLDRKGHVIGDSHVVLADGGAVFWIVSTSSPSPTIVRHLEDHIIADEVTIEDVTGSWRGVSLIGAGVEAWCTEEMRPGLSFPGRRTSGENREWIFHDDDSGPVSGVLSAARVLSDEEIERLRIASAIPSVPRDIGPADLPNEGGLDLQAISYSKGCYLGQEVMARLKSRGRVRRVLVRVAGTGAVPELPAALWRAGRREGELRSAVADGPGYSGLALVSAATAAAGSFSLASEIAPSLDVVSSA